MPYAPVLFALGRGKAFARAHLVTALLIVGLELWCVMVFPSLWAIAAIATGCTFLDVYKRQEEGRDVVRKLNGLFLLLASVFFVHFALAGRRHSRSARQSAAGRAVEAVCRGAHAAEMCIRDRDKGLSSDSE